MSVVLGMIPIDTGKQILQLANLPIWLIAFGLVGIVVGAYLLRVYSQAVESRRTDRLWGIILMIAGISLAGSFLLPNMLWEVIVPLVGLLSLITGAGKLFWDTIDRVFRKSERKPRDFGAGFILLLIGLAQVVWFVGQLGSAFR